MNTMKNLKLWSLLLLAGSILALTGCNDDDEGPAAVDIISITATGTDLTTGTEVTIDLNGVSSATDVPPDATLAVTFSREVDAATVTTSSVTLNDGTSDVALTVSVSGSTVTVSHSEELLRGTIHTISVTSALKAKDGGAFVSASRTFTTAGRAPAVIPQAAKLVVYVPFEGAVTEEMGHTVLNDNIGFAADRFGNFEASGDFNGTTNYVGVEYGVDMVNPSNTISYWIKLLASADYNTHVRTSSYVTFSLGGNQCSFHEFGRFDNGALQTDYLKDFTNHINSGSNGGFLARFNENKEEGNSPAGDLIFENDNISWLEENTGDWMHVITTYDASTSTKSVYINGILGTQWTFTTSLDGTSGTGDWTIDTAGVDADPNNNSNLYLGTGLPWWGILEQDGTVTPDRGGPFAFKGQMDDFRIFSVAFTAQEVTDLYNAEKP